MSKILIFINIVTLSQLAFIKICESSAYLYHSCIDTYGNYTNNSTYKTNLNTLLYSISTNTQINYGFCNFSAGQDPNKVNGIALCRGDVTIEDCHQCLKNSTVMLPNYCPTQKEAIIWYDYCMLRYSNRSILGVTEENPSLILLNVANVSDQDQFKVALTNFLYSLQTQAASGNSQLKFATGTANVSSLYGFSQCTPDLSFTSCFNCLGDFIRELLGCCADKIGARVIGPSCIVRYEPSLFYNLVNASSPPPLPSPAVTPPLPYTNSSGNRGKGLDIEKAAIIITIPVVILSVAVAIIFCIILTKGKSIRRKVRAHEAEDDNVSLQFDFKTIRVATNNFSEDNKLGQGGFGTVYKGKLGNGKEIAVKRLSKGSKQGNQEFKTEVSVVAKLQHRNLVRLLGFGLKQEEKLLIYEFVANGSLDYYLFDSNKRNYLDWRKRYNIITGIARGALYLHEDSRLRIIHRDLKGSNVLLDEDMNPKIADFGTARLFEADQTQGDTSRIAGTYGYMAPEYALHGLFSVKSDVYSFGVLLLEIITGRKCIGLNNPGNTEDLLSYVWRNWREETVYNIVDPVLSKGSRNQIIRCIHIGLLCVQETAEDRPSMSSVVLMLSSHSHTMPIPSNPAFVTRSGIAPYFLTL